MISLVSLLCLLIVLFGVCHCFFRRRENINCYYYYFSQNLASNAFLKHFNTCYNFVLLSLHFLRIFSFHFSYIVCFYYSPFFLLFCLLTIFMGFFMAIFLKIHRSFAVQNCVPVRLRRDSPRIWNIPFSLT